MKEFVIVTLLALLLIAPVLVAGEGQGERNEEWICPPCGAGCHEGETKVFDEPGECPVCGMRLIEKSLAKNVAILLFDGVQIIDYTGPYEVLGQVDELNVYTVSETGKTITTAMNMSVNPAYSLANAPRPDIIVVPGGNVLATYDNKKVIAWLQASAKRAEHVLSVCNGAFILARAGLLDGKTATTFYGLLDDLREFRPQVTVVEDRRFVDNGKVITSAGLSSGIDASLYLVSKMQGLTAAKALARHLEYDWDPESNYARAALADMQLPKLSLLDVTHMRALESDGDRDSWTTRVAFRTDVSAADLLADINDDLEKTHHWVRDADREVEGGERSSWSFKDRQGRPWRADVEIVGRSGADVIGTLRIDRVRSKVALTR